jgi:uncharacterized membrane protein YcaP (DUF421 family)
MDTNLWCDLFALGTPVWVGVIEKVIRTLVVYFFLIAALRLAGKRELAQLNPFDLVVLLLLSNTVQNAIIGPDTSLLGGLLGAVVLLVANYAAVRFLFNRQKLDQIVEGKEDVLIEGGRVIEKHLRRELIRLPQLATAARKQGFASLEEVDRAILEPGGTLVFQGKKTTVEDVRHRELLDRLDRLSREVAALKLRP